MDDCIERGARVTMCPVCECGHVFESFKEIRGISYEDVVDNERVTFPGKTTGFQPERCPKCGRRITALARKVPEGTPYGETVGIISIERATGFIPECQKYENPGAEKRLKHLLRSKVIGAYDEVVGSDRHYKKDVDKLDRDVSEIGRCAHEILDILEEMSHE